MDIMFMFKQKRILFEKNSLNYEMGRNIYNYFKEYKDIEIMIDYAADYVMTLGELTPEWWID
mgnify:CR=1 FL=1